VCCNGFEFHHRQSAAELANFVVADILSCLIQAMLVIITMITSIVIITTAVMFFTIVGIVITFDGLVIVATNGSQIVELALWR